MRCAADVVPVAGACLKDSDVKVKRSAAEALVYAATSLNELIGSPEEASKMPNRDEKWTADQRNSVQQARATNDHKWALSNRSSKASKLRILTSRPRWMIAIRR